MKRCLLCLGLLLIFTLNIQSDVLGDTKTNLPRNYDLRELDRVTAVKEQGELGSCWAVSITDSLESTLKTKEDFEYDLSENNMIYQTSNSYEDGFDRNYNNGGDYTQSTAYYASWRGPVLESDDVYSTKKMESKLVSGAQPIKHIQEVIFIPERKSSLDNNIIKEHVIKYGGVATSMWKGSEQTFGPFYNEEEFAWYYPHDYMNNVGNGHAVTIVGWDDDYPKENFKIQPPANGAFIVKNTKGPLWGQPDRKENMGGYFYISYYDGMLGSKLDGLVGSAVVTRVDEIRNYHNIYDYDPLGYTDSIESKISRKEAVFANVFEIGKGENEELSAVSFYTLQEDLEFEILINENYKDEKSLKNMKVIQKGKIPLPGYHTIDLDKKIKLKIGEKIAVGIKLTSNKSKPSIAIESPSGYMSTKAKSNKGESFYKKNYSNWEDINDYENNSNVCLKIFTNNNASKEEKLSVDAMLGDVNFIVQWILDHQPVAIEEGYTEEQQDIINYVYKSIKEPMTKDDFYLSINRLFTMMGDGHTNLSYRPQNPNYLNLPFKWLEEGIIVSKNTDTFKAGDKIVKLGGKTPQELNKLLYEQISSENDYWIREQALFTLNNSVFLEYFDLINHDGTVHIEVERKGKIIVVRKELEKTNKVNYKKWNEEWIKWNVEKDNNLGYFRFDSWERGEELEEIKQNMDDFFKEVSKNKIDNIVFDIRNNPGGTSGALNYLFKYLYVDKEVYTDGYITYDPAKNYEKAAEELIFRGKTYFMLSNYSYSCSIFAAGLLRDNDLITVIGEPSGEPPAFNRHGNGSDGTLPNTSWKFMMTSYRPKRPYLLDPTEDAIFPDIPVYTTKDEILTGRDIQMERMREIARDNSWIYPDETINLNSDSRDILMKDNKLIFNKNDSIKLPVDISYLNRNNVWLENTVNHNKINLTINKKDTDFEIKLPQDMDENTNYHLVIKGKNKTAAFLLSSKKDCDLYYENSLIRSQYNSKFDYIVISMPFELNTRSYASKIELKDENGKKIRVTYANRGTTVWNALIIKSYKGLEKGRYQIYIPKNTLKLINGEYYKYDINKSFKVE